MRIFVGLGVAPSCPLLAGARAPPAAAGRHCDSAAHQVKAGTVPCLGPAGNRRRGAALSGGCRHDPQRRLRIMMGRGWLGRVQRTSHLPSQGGRRVRPSGPCTAWRPLHCPPLAQTGGALVPGRLLRMRACSVLSDLRESAGMGHSVECPSPGGSQPHTPPVAHRGGAGERGVEPTSPGSTTLGRATRPPGYHPRRGERCLHGSPLRKVSGSCPGYRPRLPPPGGRGHAPEPIQHA